MDGKYLILYSTCTVVKGFLRSAIYDLEKQEFHYIPNGFGELITVFKTKCYDEVLMDFSKDEKAIILEYKDFIISNDLGFFTEHPELFPDLELSYEPTTYITNAILDRNQFSNYNLFNVITELDALSCQDLQLRFYSIIDIEELEDILKHIHLTEMKSVEVYLKYNSEKTKDLTKLINRWPKIKLLLVHSSPSNKVVHINKNNFYTSNQGNFMYTSENIESEQHCGMILKSYFSIGIETYSESLLFNSCLNKKISLDVLGNIKNCPTLQASYGKAGETPLIEVLNNDEFLSYSQIKKDQISICQDCEHRHICTDCRAFVSDIFAKPAKCSYDPYTAKWND
ncbi:grasp-with-spasm system SPASM domain peptide maturase [Pedobacter sp. D749]|uniref:grasp-with-spasm system SPASM domain peptide maturase n=1 Tax=Pedobacter sp. D749 TaxID=2856523 RepID=UPI001C57FB59|nr:grasp-with-spasm system SPASM domain peptide maturase [Pedobacter sp. D749]QXU43164.1 grasp-with-spasm system SPASM domain peptide maturase [Pedobacter sp. D749]